MSDLNTGREFIGPGGSARRALLGALALALLPVAGGAAHGAELLEAGQRAPNFTMQAHDGSKVELEALRGKWVVLYFYPRDDTAGCTKEAIGFRDNWKALQKAGVRVFGVSTDGNASHTAFANKYDLPFPLLPDEDGRLAARYQVPVIGNAARRITYLVAPDGRIARVWPEVKPVGHAEEILASVEALSAAKAKQAKTEKPATKPRKRKRRE